MTLAREDWCALGFDEGFKTVLEELDRETEYLAIPAGSIAICPACKSGDKLTLIIDGIEYETDPSCYGEEITEQTTQPMVMVPGYAHPLPLRADSFDGLGRHTPFGEVFGAALDNPLARNEAAKYLNALYQTSKSTSKITLAIRNGCVFAVRSGKYLPEAQSKISELYDRIKAENTIEIRDYEIDHKISRLRILFPELGEKFSKEKGIDKSLVPGVEIRTSGLGYSAFSVQEIWKIDSKFAYRNVSSEYHRGTKPFSVDEIYDKAMKEIFINFETEAEKLSSLYDIQMPCTESGIISLITAMFKKIGICEAVNAKSVIPFIEVERVSRGKRYVDSIAESIKNELLEEFLSYGIDITAYDVAITFLKTPERICGLPESYTQHLADACARAIDFDYAGFAEAYAKKAPVVLT